MSAKHRGRFVANHDLYPLEIDALYHREQFFRWWEPEYFLGKWQPTLSRTAKRSDIIKTQQQDDNEFHVYRNCIQCRQNDCEFVFAADDGSLSLVSQCDWGETWSNF